MAYINLADIPFDLSSKKHAVISETTDANERGGDNLAVLNARVRDVVRGFSECCPKKSVMILVDNFQRLLVDDGGGGGTGEAVKRAHDLVDSIMRLFGNRVYLIVNVYEPELREAYKSSKLWLDFNQLFK